MNTEQMKRSLMLLLTALIWGAAFVAQSVGMGYVGPFTFNSVRTLLGGLVLLPFIPILDRMKKEPNEERRERLRAQRRELMIGGVLCGVFLAVASSLQQIGILYTSAGKAGFISALYIVLVPVLGMLWGKKPSLLTWLSVGAAVAGMYLLCVKEGFSLGLGDIMLMLCALGFAGHIWVIDYFTPRVDGVRMAMIQFFVCSFLCAVPMLLYEHPQFEQVTYAWLPILYAGALSCGVAYTLQIVGQKNMNPAVASLILSLESVFAALTGWLILGEALTAREMAGCGMMFCAILMAQAPMPARTKKEG